MNDESITIADLYTTVAQSNAAPMKELAELSPLMFFLGVGLFLTAYANPRRTGFWLPETSRVRRNFGLAMVAVAVALWVIGNLNSG